MLLSKHHFVNSIRNLEKLRATSRVKWHAQLWQTIFKPCGVVIMGPQVMKTEDSACLCLWRILKSQTWPHVPGFKYVKDCWTTIVVQWQSAHCFRSSTLANMVATQGCFCQVWWQDVIRCSVSLRNELNGTGRCLIFQFAYFGSDTAWPASTLSSSQLFLRQRKVWRLWARAGSRGIRNSPVGFIVEDESFLLFTPFLQAVAHLNSHPGLIPLGLLKCDWLIDR